jgi:hypothetical protein
MQKALHKILRWDDFSITFLQSWGYWHSLRVSLSHASGPWRIPQWLQKMPSSFSSPEFKSFSVWRNPWNWQHTITGLDLGMDCAPAPPYVCLWGLATKPRSLHLPNKCSATEPQPCIHQLLLHALMLLGKPQIQLPPHGSPSALQRGRSRGQSTASWTSCALQPSKCLNLLWTQITYLIGLFTKCKWENLCNSLNTLPAWSERHTHGVWLTYRAESWRMLEVGSLWPTLIHEKNGYLRKMNYSPAPMPLLA